MKTLLKSLLSRTGRELCRLSSSELLELPANLSMNYKEAQVFRALTPSGQVSVEEAQALSKLVKGCDVERPIIEVGMLYGLSTLIICVAKAPRQKMYAVDNFSWNSLGISGAVHEAATRKRLGECVEKYELEIIKSSAQDFYDNYTGPAPALFFCDADHSYEAVKADIAWARKVNASIICGDDYAPRHAGVTRAVDEAGGPRQLLGELWVL